MAEVGTDLEQQLFVFIQSNPSGISSEDVMTNFANHSAEERVQALNKLLQKELLEILQKGNKLIYRSKDPKKTGIPKGADNEEKVVYSIIEEAGNKGIWIRDIRTKSNLNMTQLDKILKNLEKEKLIKSVKSVNVSFENLKGTK